MKWIARSRRLAWLAVAGWLALVVFLMLAPGKGSLVEDVSRAFGGSDLSDALGHVILFGVLTALLAHALSLSLPGERAVTVAVVIGLALGSMVEPAQLLAYKRGASLLDLAANWIGSLLSGWLLRRLALIPRVEANKRARPAKPGADNARQGR